MGEILFCCFVVALSSLAAAEVCDSSLSEEGSCHLLSAPAEFSTLVAACDSSPSERGCSRHLSGRAGFSILAAYRGYLVWSSDEALQQASWSPCFLPYFLCRMRTRP